MSNHFSGLPLIPSPLCRLLETHNLSLPTPDLGGAPQKTLQGSSDEPTMALRIARLRGGLSLL